MQILNYFKLGGRISRQTWWLGQLVITILYLAVMYIISFVFAGVEQSLRGEAGLASSEDLGDIGLALIFAAFLIYIWVAICLNAQRWHDRDKSAWWMLLGLVPIVGLWALIENGFLKGTEGPNSYGADPLQD